MATEVTLFRVDTPPRLVEAVWWETPRRFRSHRDVGAAGTVVLVKSADGVSGDGHLWFRSADEALRNALQEAVADQRRLLEDLKASTARVQALTDLLNPEERFSHLEG